MREKRANKEISGKSRMSYRKKFKLNSKSIGKTQLGCVGRKQTRSEVKRHGTSFKRLQNSALGLEDSMLSSMETDSDRSKKDPAKHFQNTPCHQSVDLLDFPDNFNSNIMDCKDEARMLRRLSLNLRGLPKSVGPKVSKPKSMRNAAVPRKPISENDRPIRTRETGMEITLDSPRMPQPSCMLHTQFGKNDSQIEDDWHTIPDKYPFNPHLDSRILEKLRRWDGFLDGTVWDDASSTSETSFRTTHEAKKGQKTMGGSVTEYGKSQDKVPASLGELVWSKIGSSQWWPAIIIHGQLAGKEPARDDFAWVFWFGDHKISEIHTTKLRSFVGEYSDCLRSKRGNLFKRALNECLQECVSRAGIVDHLSEDQSEDSALKWADMGFLSPDNKKCDMAPKGNCMLPKWIGDRLDNTRKNLIQGNCSEEEEEELPNFVLKSQRRDLKLVKAGAKLIEDVCISCTTEGTSVVSQHPMFDGGLCESCKDEFMHCLFMHADDGYMMYCAICANEGEVFVCDQPCCNRVYCHGCILSLVGEDQLSVVENTDPWLCYVCNTNKTQDFGLLSLKPDWEINLVRLYRPIGPLYPPLPVPEKRRRMRVLSLFDGLGAGKVALDEMGLDIEAYFTSENDVKSNIIFDYHHNIPANQLGDVFSLSKNKILELCPIDLLIGSAPPEEFEQEEIEIVPENPEGLLFFQFLQIRETIAAQNKKIPLFWMFEKTRDTSDQCRDYISRFLGCAPACLDSKVCSALMKERYYWGNLPGLHSPLEVDRGPDSLLFSHLNSHLVNIPNFIERTAKMEKISEEDVLKSQQGAMDGNVADQKLPVMMADKMDALWTIETEMVYGFPQHYTDYGPVTPIIRKHLLCQSWSIPLIKLIFRPLTKYFAQKKDGNNNSKTAPSKNSSNNSKTTPAENSKNNRKTTPSVSSIESSLQVPEVFPTTTATEITPQPSEPDPKEHNGCRRNGQRCKGKKPVVSSRKGKSLGSKEVRNECNPSFKIHHSPATGISRPKQTETRFLRRSVCKSSQEGQESPQPLPQYRMETPLSDTKLREHCARKTRVKPHKGKKRPGSATKFEG